MFVNIFLLNGNPFIESYAQSDGLGKLIFLSLYLLSILSWGVIIYKSWVTYQIKKQSTDFHRLFQGQKKAPLNLNLEGISKKKTLSPFLDLYLVLKKQSLEILAKNHHFKKQRSTEEMLSSTSPSYLSLADIDYIASHLATQVSQEVKNLERHLYILSTTVSLAPFLGLLGTVWGILLTFSEMQAQGGGMTNQSVLSGLSLALATTVLGLVNAIPALLGYNYLKNSIQNFSIDMEGFSNEILASVELQYRKVED